MKGIDVKTGIRNRMSEKEKTFCEYFALWGDAVRSRRFCGYENPKRDGPQLLCQSGYSQKN